VFVLRTSPMSSARPGTDPPDLETRVEKLETKVRRLTIRFWATWECILWAAVGLPILYIAIRFDRPGGGILWPRIYDILHVVLSLVLALILVRLSRRLLVGFFRSPLPHYALAATFAAGVGGGIEVLQLLTHGDASIRDFIRDVLGSAAGLCIALSRERYERWPFRSSIAHRWGARAAAAAALALAFLPIARTLTVLNMRNRAFPRLCGFEASWERQLVEPTGGALLTTEKPPKEFTLAQGQFVGKVAFAPDSLSGLALKNFPPNWSTFSSLQFEVYSDSKSVVPLELRVHDGKHRNQYSDRFNLTLQVEPGQTTVTVPLADIRKGPAYRTMDMTNIKGVIVFIVNPAQHQSLYFDEFRLR
jgi:hypothetical protein